MSWFGDLVGGIEDLFGFGGNDDDKKKKRRHRPPTRYTPDIIQPTQPQPRATAQQPQLFKNNNFAQSLVSDKSKNNRLGGVTLQPPKQSRLNQLTQNYMPEAKKQAEQGENWFERNILDRDSNNEIATNLARTHAESVYSRNHDYQKTPELEQFQQKSKKLQNKTSNDVNNTANFWNDVDKTIHNPIVQDIAGPAEAASLGTLRALTGLGKSFVDLPDSLVHFSTWLGNEATGSHGDDYFVPEYQKKLDAITDQANKPFDWLGKKTDQAIDDTGTVAQKLYLPAQVAANVATILPAVGTLATKVGQGVKLADEAGNVVRGAERGPDVVPALANFGRSLEAAGGYGRVGRAAKVAKNRLLRRGEIDLSDAAGLSDVEPAVQQLEKNEPVVASPESETPIHESPPTPKDVPTTEKPPGKKPPAITSPNRPAPVVEQPKPLPVVEQPKPLPVVADQSIPEQASITLEPPQIPQEVTEEVPKLTPEQIRQAQLEQVAQKQARAQAAKRARQSKQAARTPKTAPLQTLSEAKAAAQAATETPISQEAVAQAAAKAARRNAPTEAIADTVQQNTKDIDAVHQQISQEMQRIDDMLAPEGKSFEDLAAKMYHNDTNPSDIIPYTDAELKAKNLVNQITRENADLFKTNQFKPLEVEGRSQHYAPASKGNSKTTDGIPYSVQESANTLPEAGFTKARKGRMSSKEVKKSTRRAYREERAHALYSRDYTAKQFKERREQELEGEDRQLFGENKNQDMDTALSDEDLSKIRKRNEAVAGKESDYRDALNKYNKRPSDTTAKQLTKSYKGMRSARLKKNVNQRKHFVEVMEKRYKKLRKKYKTSVNSREKDELKAKMTQVYEQYNAGLEKMPYLQSFIDANLLGQPRGRLADLFQTTIEKPTQAAADTLARRVANAKADEKLFADRGRAKQLYKQFKQDGTLQSQRKQGFNFNKEFASQQTNKLAKADTYRRAYTTGATELGSLEKKPAIDTISIFLAKGERMGLKGKQLDSFVRKQLGSDEWEKILENQWRFTNSYTGVASLGHSGNDFIENGLSGLDNVIKKYVASRLPLSLRGKNFVAKILQRSLIGYTRAAYRVTKRQAQRSVMGMDSLVKAVRAEDPVEKAEYYRRAVQDAQAGAAFNATGAAFGAYMMATGRMTGAYPSDPKKRAEWVKDGKTPYSIRIDGHWVKFARYAPEVYVPMMIGGLAQGKDLSVGSVYSVVSEVFQGALDNAGVSGLIGTLQKLTGPLSDYATKNEWQRLFSSIVNMNIPASGLFSTAARATDSYKRDTNGNYLTGTLKNIGYTLPWVRNQLAKRRGPFGDAVKNDRWSSLFYVSEGSKPTVVTRELDRLGETGNPAYPDNPYYESLKTVDGTDVPLSSKQQSSLDKYVRQEEGHNAKLLMQSSRYKNASDSEKADMLSKVYGVDNQMMKKQWAKKNLPSKVSKKVKSGSRGKEDNINNSLDPSLQQALVTVKPMTADQRGVWTEDPNHALAYYTARYDNLKANNALQDGDKRKDSTTSLAYKRDEAKTDVNFMKEHSLDEQDILDLKALYHSTSVKEWRDLASGTTKALLTAYDKARTSNGVSLRSSDHSKPRYYASSSGSGGGSSRPALTFATLPKSLVGVDLGSGGAGGYAAPKKLYTRVLAPKSTHATVNIPERRTISVRKGVHV